MMRTGSVLPQTNGRLFLTDGGLETELIFHKGIELPYFAAFDLLRSEDGTKVLEDYYMRYAEIALEQRMGLILESPTWRASPDWGDRLGYTRDELRLANIRGIELLVGTRRACQTPETPIVISGCLGPRGDGYDPGTLMRPEEAQRYHAQQLAWFAEAGADMASAFTMTNTSEAIGIVRAAGQAGLPICISFTVETDGRLPTGTSLGDAIDFVDAETDGAVAYYMVNCAHPTHFADELAGGGDWTRRVRGVRANASTRSHAELDEADELDDGDPQLLGRQYADLMGRLPSLTIVGGCCGTDHRHISEIAAACVRVV